MNQWEASCGLQHASEALLTMSTKARPDDQKHQAATRDLFQAVGNVLEASLSSGPEEPIETSSSQVGVPGQMPTSRLPHDQLTPAVLGGSFSPPHR